MSTSRDFSLPSGVSRPLQNISHIDQSGLIAILAAFSLSLILAAVPIRTFVRGKLGRWGGDDFAFFAAAIVGVIQSSTVFIELTKGLGKSEELLDLRDKLPREKIAYASEILYIIAVYFSKSSTAFFFLRLTPGRDHSVIIWIAIFVSTAWMISSTLILAIRCHPTESWTDISSNCASLLPRWIYICTLDIVTEIYLFAISIYLVYGIQMPLRSKSTVISAFSFRLPTIALSALHLHYLALTLRTPQPTQNQPLKASSIISCAQLQISYSIISSIVPYLKNFMVAFDKPLTERYSYSRGGNYALSQNRRRHGKDDQDLLVSMSIFGSSGSGGREEEGYGSREGTISSTGTFGKISNSKQCHMVELGLGTGVGWNMRPEGTRYEAKVICTVLSPIGDGSEGSREGKLGEGPKIGDRNRHLEKMVITKGVEWSVDFDRKKKQKKSRSAEKKETV